MKHTLRRTSAFICAMTVMTASMAFGGMTASAVEPNKLDNLFSAESQVKLGSVTTGGESDYTITIPATLTVANTGWNALEGGITAKGSLAEGKKLVVSAASENSWKLVANKGEESEANVGYNLAATGDNTSVYSATATAPTWEFTALTADGTSQTAGIIVEDYSNKPAGTYQDVVTFTASVESAATKLTSSTVTWLDGNYIATENVTISSMVTVGENVTLTINDGVTVKLTNGMEISDAKTLTINGTGTLNVTGAAGTSSISSVTNGSPAIKGGEMIVNGGSVNATGGIGGGGYFYYKDGGTGGAAITANITVHGGAVTATGGAGGNGSGNPDVSMYSSGGNGGNGITGTLTVDGGQVIASGGNGGTKGGGNKSDGTAGKGLTGTFTPDGLSVQGSTDHITWSEASTNYADYQYVMIDTAS